MLKDMHIPRAMWVLGGLGIAVVACVLMFMTIDVNGNWDFIIPFRGRKLAGIFLVSIAIAVSTVLFQTITHNRILTPAIMGFDALYRLIQTCLLFFLGSIGLSAFDVRILFFAEAGIMLVFSMLLFRWLFSGGLRSLHLMILVGFLFGALFRSLGDFLLRIMNPNEFAILQDRTFARFSAIDESLLGIASICIVCVLVTAWHLRHRLDVVALGRDTAINLGVDFKKTVSLVLFLISVLVSVSTALVGPVTFFGLLVANLAYLLVGSMRHAVVLPAAALIAVLCLVGGQLILENVFAFDTSLSIIIEFVGGIVFIALLLRGAGR